MHKGSLMACLSITTNTLRTTRSDSSLYITLHSWRKTTTNIQRVEIDELLKNRRPNNESWLIIICNIVWRSESIFYSAFFLTFVVFVLSFPQLKIDGLQECIRAGDIRLLSKSEWSIAWWRRSFATRTDQTKKQSLRQIQIHADGHTDRQAGR